MAAELRIENYWRCFKCDGSHPDCSTRAFSLRQQLDPKAHICSCPINTPEYKKEHEDYNASHSEQWDREYDEWEEKYYDEWLTERA